jgi:hypothetical protein
MEIHALEAELIHTATHDEITGVFRDYAKNAYHVYVCKPTHTAV